MAEHAGAAVLYRTIDCPAATPDNGESSATETGSSETTVAGTAEP